MLSNFRSNLKQFLNNPHEHPQYSLEGQESSTILSTSFFFSWDFRTKISYLISNKQMENPKSKIDFSTSPSVKNMANPDFYLGVSPSKDPPLKSINLKKKKDLVFLDLTLCYLSTTDSLKGLHKFSCLQYLCLCDCGIVELPNDIVNLPKTIRSLDLSKNYISQIPNDIHWKQLEHLSLSDNAFTKWPDSIDSDKLPNIVFLNFSQNSIASHISLNSPFAKLQALSFEYNPFSTLPDWLLKCTELRLLSFKGCTNIQGLSLNSLFNLPNLALLDVSDVKIDDIQSLNKIPQSLSLIICRRPKKDYLPNYNVSIHNVNCADENLYSCYSKSNIPTNNEFDFSLWDLG